MWVCVCVSMCVPACEFVCACVCVCVWECLCGRRKDEIGGGEGEGEIGYER